MVKSLIFSMPFGRNAFSICIHFFLFFFTLRIGRICVVVNNRYWHILSFMSSEIKLNELSYFPFRTIFLVFGGLVVSLYIRRHCGGTYMYIIFNITRRFFSRSILINVKGLVTDWPLHYMTNVMILTLQLSTFLFYVVTYHFHLFTVCMSPSWFYTQEHVLRMRTFQNEADYLPISWCCKVIMNLV
jgi:hypothetical protein